MADNTNEEIGRDSENFASLLSLIEDKGYSIVSHNIGYCDEEDGGGVEFIGIRRSKDSQWLEENAKNHGFERVKRKKCCMTAEKDANYCEECGAGVNGVIVYLRK